MHGLINDFRNISCTAPGRNISNLSSSGRLTTHHPKTCLNNQKKRKSLTFTVVTAKRYSLAVGYYNHISTHPQHA